MHLVSFKSLAVTLAMTITIAWAGDLQAQMTAGDDFDVVWSLDPRDDAELFPRGPAFGARSVLVGMDFDSDGNEEFLFTTDETLAPGGPDPGFLEVFLYENTGDDTYEHVWHYTHVDGSNSLPPIGYGDIDEDGLFEIYFGIPTINDDPNDLFVFEQNEDLTFPDSPTVTWGYDRDGAADFRPSGFYIGDVDGDGKQELVTTSRTSGARDLVIATPDNGIDAFTTWTIEFEAGEDILGGGGVYDVDAYDFDNDGLMEIWVNTWDLFSYAVWEATAPDTYELQAEINQADGNGVDHGQFNSHKFLFDDIDDDGRAELLVPSTEGTLFFLDDMDDVSMLTGDSFASVLTFNDPSIATDSRGADIGDLDNDGMTDIVISLGRGQSVIRLEHNGGPPADSTSYDYSVIVTNTDTTVARFYPPRIADDLDNDGQKEVVMTNLFATEIGLPLMVIAEVKASAPTAGGIEAGDDFDVAWSLDPRDFPELFPRGPAFGSKGVLAGMDSDNDGNLEFLFTTDETVAPQGPDPGFLEVFLYENTGDDTYEHVWHYTHPNGSNSFPALAYGDIDDDGLFEIYFGIPTIGDEVDDLFVFEQNEDLTFPAEPTTAWGYDRDPAADFRPSGFKIADADGDGVQELITTSRTGGNREMVVATPDGGINAFTTWTIELEVGENVLGGGGVYDVDVFDFDNDGMMEIWVNTWDLFSMAVFESTGPDAYEMQFEINQGYPGLDHGSYNGHHFLFYDVDGDGRSEYFLPSTEGILFFLDDVDDVSTLTAESFIPVTTFSAPGSRGGDIDDIDGDGMADLIIGLGQQQSVIRLEYNGGDPADSTSYDMSTVVTNTDTTGAYFYPLRISDDLDGDGRKEIIMTNRAATEIGLPLIVIAEVKKEVGTATEAQSEIPEGYALSQNYPNPFNPSSTIVFEVPESAQVEVAVFDMTGRMVAVLSSGPVSAGTHTVTFDGGELPSGVYMIRMQTPFGALTRKAMLLK